MKKLITLIFVISLILLSCNIVISAQKWQELRPLVSTCRDIRVKLRVNKCDNQIADYQFPNYRIGITFTENENLWKVPKGRVAYIFVIFKKAISLKEYIKTSQLDLSKYQKIIDGDIYDSVIYTNEKEGIKITVENESWITSITLFPANKKNY